MQQLMQLELFNQLDSKRRQSVQHELKLLIDRQNAPQNVLKAATDYPFLSRRDSKLLSKKYQAVQLYLFDEMKPRHIAKKLKLSVDLVYACVQKFKTDIKTLTSPPKAPGKCGRKKERDHPVLLETIDSYIRANGIYDITAAKLRSHLLELRTQNKLSDEVPIPSQNTLLKVLKETFHLRYGHL